MRASDPLSRATTITPAVAPPAPPRPSAERFSLRGPTCAVDRRVNAIRADVADIALAGRLFSPHYARPLRRCLIAAATMLRTAPDAAAPASSELLLGEGFDLLDVSGGWAWGSCAHDRYVGYLPASALGVPIEPTHIVTAPRALLFAAPDIKAPAVALWPIGARFAAAAEGDFLRADGGFVHRRHAALLGDRLTDPVAVAEALVGTPYKWGGRSADGIDCSGLVQLALGLCGIAAPRDSDQQRDSLGGVLAKGDRARRGDIVFFPGHVGLMTDGERLVHANAFHMAVTIEPLADVVARLAADHAEPILARRRLTP